jgi:FMN reductase
VLLTAVGGGLRHSLVVEHQLRPLFGFFEASTISTAIYACAAELTADGAQTSLLEARIANAVDQFANHFAEAKPANAEQGRDE